MARPIIKQFDDLRPEDFRLNPIWISVHALDCDEEWYGETDEDTFRPWLGERPVGANEMFLVSARFKFADGAEFEGFVTPAISYKGLRDMGALLPQVFMASGERFAFWRMLQYAESEAQFFYRSFGKSSNQVFPVEFQALPGLTSCAAAGTIPGFMAISRGEEVEVTK